MIVNTPEVADIDPQFQAFLDQEAVRMSKESADRQGAAAGAEPGAPTPMTEPLSAAEQRKRTILGLQKTAEAADASAKRDEVHKELRLQETLGDNKETRMKILADLESSRKLLNDGIGGDEDDVIKKLKQLGVVIEAGQEGATLDKFKQGKSFDGDFDADLKAFKSRGSDSESLNDLKLEALGQFREEKANNLDTQVYSFDEDTLNEKRRVLDTEISKKQTLLDGVNTAYQVDVGEFEAAMTESRTKAQEIATSLLNNAGIQVNVGDDQSPKEILKAVQEKIKALVDDPNSGFGEGSGDYQLMELIRVDSVKAEQDYDGFQKYQELQGEMEQLKTSKDNVAITEIDLDNKEKRCLPVAYLLCGGHGCCKACRRRLLQWWGDQWCGVCDGLLRHHNRDALG